MLQRSTGPTKQGKTGLFWISRKLEYPRQGNGIIDIKHRRNSHKFELIGAITIKGESSNLSQIVIPKSFTINTGCTLGPH
jgi:hypothetical protein